MIFAALFVSFLVFPNTIAARPISGVVTAGRAVNASLSGPSPAVGHHTRHILTLDTLWEGNKRTLDHSRVRQTEEEDPSFMFLGCSDNRNHPDTVFDAPDGSFIAHNNIANRYTAGERSTEAALANAIESEQVQHIIILGHYGCKSVAAAIAGPAMIKNSFLRDWIQPITDLYQRSRRIEIVDLRNSRKPQRGQPEGVKGKPHLGDPGLKALVEENVKRSVSELSKNAMLRQVYDKARRGKTTKDIFVHGLVLDEATGQVVNLRVSFGPPGKAIPHVPFPAVAAARNRRSARPRGNIFRGKKFDFSKIT